MKPYGGKSFWARWETTPMMDNNWRLTLYMAISFLAVFFLGLILSFVPMILLGLVMLVLYVMPRFSKHGRLYLNKLRDEFIALVRTDVVPKPPLGKMTLAVLMIGCPLYLFWFISTLLLFFMGYEFWLVTTTPALIVSAVVFQSVKWRWAEMDGKKWMFWLIHLGVYAVCLGLSYLIHLAS